MKFFINLRILVYIYILWCMFFSGYLSSVSAEDNDSKKKPVHNLKNNSFIRDWLILGALPNPLAKDPLPNGSSQTGFHKDYLVSLGGEVDAQLSENLEIFYKDEHNIQHSVRSMLVKAGETGIIDFEKHFGAVDHKVAYAFCYIYSTSEQDAVFLFGSDDGAKVWINGTLVHNLDVGRGLTFREDKFTVQLKEGLNPVLVKISEWVREWAFAMEVFDQAGYEKIQKHQRYMADFDDFLETTLVPEQTNTWNYVFGPGEFPKLEWEKPYLVEKLFGKFSINVRWFDNQLNEVQIAEKSGRYLFYAEAVTAEGLKIRRAGTLYCMPWEWMAWAERPKAYLDYIPLTQFNKLAWINHREKIADYAGRILLLSMLDQKEGAVLLSFLDEMEYSKNPVKSTDTPVIKENDYHLALKRKLLEVERKWLELKLPKPANGIPTPVLNTGTEKEAGVHPCTKEKLRNVCHNWFEASKEPFSVLVARHGIIVLHEAFGENQAGKINTETPMEIASISKLLTGVLFARFVEQGLINIDDPVGKYLPDFPVTGKKAITLRHCFTHTSGLWSHEEWGGMHDPWLDNKIYNILSELEVGKHYTYNGMGYNLAGKVMEIISGKSIFRLMREQIFNPMGLENTVMEEDLAFSCHSNAGELAVIAQLLLNEGSYGNKIFFSPQTLDTFLPQKLNTWYPGINVEQGIGITWMTQQHPDAGKNDLPADATILSKKVFGHGSATSAILRIDPENDLVITQTRRRAGMEYDKYLNEFLLSIDVGLIN